MKCRCFQCKDAEKVFINSAEEMIGGSYKCKYTNKAYNGRSTCHIPVREKREYNGILHQTCKYCVTYASYCKKHNRNIDDVFWGDTCMSYLRKHINGHSIERVHINDVHNYELEQLKELLEKK